METKAFTIIGIFRHEAEKVGPSGEEPRRGASLAPVTARNSPRTDCNNLLYINKTIERGGFGMFGVLDIFDAILKQRQLDANTYGFINSCLKSLVIENFGEDTWEKLRQAAGVDESFLNYKVYDDSVTISLVERACEMLNIQQDWLLYLFGEHFFQFCCHSGHALMLRTLAADLPSFLDSLDSLHSFLTLSYKELDMNAPSFRVERTPVGHTLLHYYSDRKGLSNIVPGIVNAVAKDFYGSEVTLTVVQNEEDSARTAKRHHVAFHVKQHEVTKSKETDKRTMPEEGEKEKEEGTIELLGKSREDFIPAYPKRLLINVETFCDVFPFHVIFDEELRVCQAGLAAQRLIPGLHFGVHFSDCFSLIQPPLPVKASMLRCFPNAAWVLRAQDSKHKRSIDLRGVANVFKSIRLSCKVIGGIQGGGVKGQMVWMDNPTRVLFICSPKLRSVQELEVCGLHLSDLAPHDATRDLVLLNQQRLAEIHLAAELERREQELRIMSRHLEQEKRKSEALLAAMLPEHVAQQLRNGHRVPASDFSECTILFSDVVSFTTVCAASTPSEVLELLDSMFRQLDRLTAVHGVYKVETIGDAYMVVGGVPVPDPNHAYRVANFGLAMLLAISRVHKPRSEESVQLRVGMHTGRVMAGVLGDKMPRYCLLGDTVNTASRMESHGKPGRVHFSTVTLNRLLEGGPYEIECRGHIEVKGKGRMLTYFLVGHLKAKETELLGLPDDFDSDTDEGPLEASSIPMIYTTEEDAQHQQPTGLQSSRKQMNAERHEPEVEGHEPEAEGNVPEDGEYMPGMQLLAGEETRVKVIKSDICSLL
uniref:guanylate cyclase soluble subunit beta-2-like n=1 Tax=Myxine glutinosa TaxID=7769 RepID=UPI00358EB1DB